MQAVVRNRGDYGGGTDAIDLERSLELIGHSEGEDDTAVREEINGPFVRIRLTGRDAELLVGKDLETVDELQVTETVDVIACGNGEHNILGIELGSVGLLVPDKADAGDEVVDGSGLGLRRDDRDSPTNVYAGNVINSSVPLRLAIALGDGRDGEGGSVFHFTAGPDVGEGVGVDTEVLKLGLDSEEAAAADSGSKCTARGSNNPSAMSLHGCVFAVEPNSRRHTDGNGIGPSAF